MDELFAAYDGTDVPGTSAVVIRHGEHNSGLIDDASLIPDDFDGQVSDCDVLEMMHEQRGPW